MDAISSLLQSALKTLAKVMKDFILCLVSKEGTAGTQLRQDRAPLCWEAPDSSIANNDTNPTIFP